MILLLAMFSLNLHLLFFRALFVTTKGNFTINVVTSWAPPYATRFYHLIRLNYMAGASLYRVLYINSSESFVVQYGYRGDSPVDSCWDNKMTSNATWSVHPPGNVRGSVSFSMNAVAQDHTNPNCTSPVYCAQGFSTNIFINYNNNTRLDQNDFSPFGFVSERDMKDVVDKFYSGYGDVKELCDEESKDPYCVGLGENNRGVSMDRLVSEGNHYVRNEKPLLDFVITTSMFHDI